MLRLLGKKNAVTMIFPRFLLLNMPSYDIKHPFRQFGSVVVDVFLPTSCPLPAYSLAGQRGHGVVQSRVGKRERLNAA